MKHIEAHRFNSQRHTLRHIGLTLLALCLATIIGSGLLTPTKAAPVLKEIDLPSGSSNPWGITLDKKGNEWIAIPQCDPKPFLCQATVQGQLIQVDTVTFAVKNVFQQPANHSSPFFVATAPDGSLWFTEPASHALGQLFPNTHNPAASIWKLWTIADASPFTLTFDAYGNIWFTDPLNNRIGWFQPVLHSYHLTAIPTADSQPYGITREERTGQIWFTENNSSVAQLASFAPSITGTLTTQAIKEYPVVRNGTNTTPHLLTTDGRGNVWWTGGFDGNIGRLIIKDAQPGTSNGMTQWNTPVDEHTSGIAVASNGVVWFTDSNGDSVLSFDPASEQFTTTKLDANAHPHDGLTVHGNQVFFTEEFGNKAGTIQN